MNFLLIVLWMLFAAEVYYAESVVEGTTITSYSGFFWTAAFSSAGIADMTVDGVSELLGRIWIVLGSTPFSGRLWRR